MSACGCYCSVRGHCWACVVGRALPRWPTLHHTSRIRHGLLNMSPQVAGVADPGAQLWHRYEPCAYARASGPAALRRNRPRSASHRMCSISRPRARRLAWRRGLERIVRRKRGPGGQERQTRGTRTERGGRWCLLAVLKSGGLVGSQVGTGDDRRWPSPAAHLLSCAAASCPARSRNGPLPQLPQVPVACSHAACGPVSMQTAPQPGQIPWICFSACSRADKLVSQRSVVRCIVVVSAQAAEQSVPFMISRW